MSNDTHRLLRYMYGELDAAESEQMEHALVHRPDLFERWFAFHEVKQQLDAQQPTRPDASVVDQIVDQARTAAQSRSSAEPSSNERLPIRGDGVPQRETVWCSVTRLPAHDAPSCGPESLRRDRGPATPKQETQTEALGASLPDRRVAWAAALVLGMVFLLSGTPEPETSSKPFTHEVAVSTELPAWDAPGQRVALHRQAATLQARMPASAQSTASSQTW